MWYYVEFGRKNGPVGEQTLALLLSNGTINNSTLVWKEGMPDWKPLSETELAESLLSLAPMVDATVITPRVNPSGLKTLFTWFIITTIAYTALYSVFIFLIPQSDFSTFTGCIYGPLAIASSVLMYILLYKFWKIIQDGFAKTTPGKAVGYSFIPFFNFYWLFIAIGSLAGELNHYILRHFKYDPSGIRQAHPAFAWIYILFTFGSTCVSSFTVFQAFSQGFSQTSPAYGSQEYMLRFLVILVISWTLSLITFFDFYLTSKSIVDRESTQH